MLAITAFCIVALLQIVAREPVEFEGFGLKFKGAAGPVFLWMFCFMALVAAVKVLW